MRADAPLLVTEALLRGAIAGMMTDTPPAVLDEKVWLETIRLASAHLVLPALATGLDAAGPGWAIDAETRAYLELIRDGNAARNRALRAALAGIVSRLQHEGIDPVVVKGGAWLAASADAAPWRFMGDLDLIVGEGELAAAVAILRSSGFTPADGDYDADRDAHAPAMLGPDGQTIVELHSRVFADGVWTSLEMALATRTQSIACEGTGIRIPEAEVRAAHLILHSQAHHAYHAQHRLLLRDLIELGMLVRAPGWSGFADALGLVPEASREGAGALLSAVEEFGIETPGIILESSQRVWARRARNRLTRRVFHRQLTGALALARHEARRLFQEPRRTIRLAKDLAQPARVARKLQKKITKIRNRSAS